MTGEAAVVIGVSGDVGGPPDRLFTPDSSAERLLRVIAHLSPADSGGIFAWDGARIDP